MLVIICLKIRVKLICCCLIVFLSLVFTIFVVIFHINLLLTVRIILFQAIIMLVCRAFNYMLALLSWTNILVAKALLADTSDSFALGLFSNANKMMQLLQIFLEFIFYCQNIIFLFFLQLSSLHTIVFALLYTARDLSSQLMVVRVATITVGALWCF
jgi:hypothetical protein